MDPYICCSEPENVCPLANQIPEEKDRARPWNPKVALLFAGLTSSTSKLLQYIYPEFVLEQGNIAAAFDAFSESPEVKMVPVLMNFYLSCKWEHMVDLGYTQHNQCAKRVDCQIDMSLGIKLPVEHA